MRKIPEGVKVAGIVLAILVGVVSVIAFIVLLIDSGTMENKSPGSITLLDGTVVQCEDLWSYGWGADGWSCENGDQTTSYPKERVASATYN